MNFNYCPDCGKYLTVEWHVVRCSNCSAKRQSVNLYNRVVPRDKYCKKCGEATFRVEVKSELNFFEVNYATFKFKEAKTVEETILSRRSRTKVWLDPVIPNVYTAETTGINGLKYLPVTVSS